jgi:methionine synthase II (cobalamin-independent)
MESEAMGVELVAGWATGIGAVPHDDPVAAAEFVLELLPDLPAVPWLPRRTRTTELVAMALAGVPGVRVGDGTTIEVDALRVRYTPIVPDLDQPGLAGLRAFLVAAAGRTGPVKWQLVGPITVAVELMRRGVPARTAFDVATRAVHAYGTAIHHAIAEALPACEQLAFIDEPALTTLMCPGFPLPAEDAIDVVSGAMASLEPGVTAGLHCCGYVDWAAVLTIGPPVLSLPVRADVIPAAGYLSRFLKGGGWIAWGAVPTSGPVGGTVDRHWRELSDLWCELVRGGCDAVRLRSQALVTPACGLARLDEGQARRTLELVRGVAERVASQAVASKLSLGA